MKTIKANWILPNSNQVMIEISKKDFEKEFAKNKKIVETKTQLIYFNDLEYIFCTK